MSSRRSKPPRRSILIFFQKEYKGPKNKILINEAPNKIHLAPFSGIHRYTVFCPLAIPLWSMPELNPPAVLLSWRNIRGKNNWRPCYFFKLLRDNLATTRPWSTLLVDYFSQIQMVFAPLVNTQYVPVLGRSLCRPSTGGFSIEDVHNINKKNKKGNIFNCK